MDLIQFATFVDSFDKEDMKMDIFNRFQFAYNFTDHLVLCKTIVELSKQDTILLKAELDCMFKIDAESASAMETVTEATIPPGLLAQFASLSYGSLRGVVFIKTSDNPFSSFILPPNDVTSFFKEPLTFPRNS